MAAPSGPIDLRLKDWASPKQAEYLDLVYRHGSMRAAAKAAGVNPSAVTSCIDAVKRKAALYGYSPGNDMTHTAPSPFVVKGTSTYYDRDGEVRGQWVKTTLDADRREEQVRLMVGAMMEEARGLAPVVPPPITSASSLLAVYAFGDPHFGMYAWSEEAGEDFDLNEADRLTRAGIDRLNSVAPPAETAILLFIGDNTHGDNATNRTPGHGHALDVDTRHAKVMQVTARAVIYSIQRTLEKHAKVIVWFMRGNHDPETAQALALCLSLYFENEPRVQVDLSPSLFRYHLHGKVLIGAHHGHTVKQSDLPLLMAVDRPKEWGASSARFVYMGHVHHDSVKEVQGVRVESIRTLAPKDAWHAGEGYRSMRDTRVIVHHEAFGEIERHTCAAAMLEVA